MPGSNLGPSWNDLGARQQGLICGGKISLEKNDKKFTYGTVLYGLELVVAAWESGEHVFSIEQLNKRKSARPWADACYQITEGAPWGGGLSKKWPDVVVVNPPQEALALREWMNRPMPTDIGMVGPGQVLVIWTVEEYMTVDHKVWGNTNWGEMIHT
jgi:hypothetical protein